MVTAELLSLQRACFYWGGGTIISTKEWNKEQLEELVGAAIGCLQDRDREVQEAGIEILKQHTSNGYNLALHKRELLAPLLGALFAHYPTFKSERREVLCLIGKLVPSLEGDDFDAVIWSLQPLKEKSVCENEELVKTIGLLVAALGRSNYPAKEQIDGLLHLLLHAVQEPRCSLVGTAVVTSGVLSEMNEKQRTWFVNQLHGLVEKDFAAYASSVLPILAEISRLGSQSIVTTRFSRQLLNDLVQYGESLNRSVAIFGLVAFSNATEQEQAKLRENFVEETDVSSAIADKYGPLLNKQPKSGPTLKERLA